MEKIKSVLSHGVGKENDNAHGRHDTPTAAEFDRSNTAALSGEGSHLGGAKQSEHHPIYDQYAKGNNAGEPIQTTDHAPHFSNTPHVPKTTSSYADASSAPSATSSLHPDQYLPAPREDTSTASIKSGVIGFPQGSNDAHAARATNNPFEQRQHGGNQAAPNEDLLGARTCDQTSHLGQGVGLGAGAVGAGALAEHGSRGRPEESNLGGLGETPHINTQRQVSDVPESGRSFPLAGGVTQRAPTTTATSEREPGTKERETRPHEDRGCEGLAGAAATATRASTMPQDDERTEANTQTQASRSANPEALVAATTATAAAYGWGNHDHGGHGHKFEGERLQSPDAPKSDLLFKSGPHVTDTANRLDPHLHIPGEYPSPTPVEEENAPSYLQSKPVAETSPSAFAEPELRHTGSLDQPQSRSAEPTSQHHYDRDAAIAGGVGETGAGAYAAGKHHQKESTDIDQNSFPDEPNPYYSQQIYPRIDTTPRGGFVEQRYDPTASKNRTPRNAALPGDIVNSSRPSEHEAPGERELENKGYPTASQDVKPDSQHHYGRDAALVGASAATTAGLYVSQRDNEPDSGLASSTIGPHKSNVANVLDPRVQPDHNLQKHHYAAPTVEDPAPSTVGPHKSDVANVLDPRVLPDPQKQKAAPKEAQSNQVAPNVPDKDPRREEHHYGRDAAIAGSTGAAGYGAYEVAKTYGEHPSTQPSASMNDQRYDPSAPGAHEPEFPGSQPSHASTQDQQHHYGPDTTIAGGLGAAVGGTYAATREHGGDKQYPGTGGQTLGEQRYNPTASTQQSGVPQGQHHYGRDAAVVGETGVLGAGAYAATHGQDQTQQPLANRAYDQPDTAVHQRYDSAQVPEEDHTKRNAALGTAAGAGALGAGAYGFSQHEAQKEQERLSKEQQKALDNQQKALGKRQVHDQKHHDKLVAAEEKKRQKEAEHKEHEHANQLEKQQKEHDERLAAARVEQERHSQEPEGEGMPEKKHRFLTFLNKKDKDREGSAEHSPRQSRDGPRHSREYAAGAAPDEHEDGRHLGEKHGRHVLHKDPPKGHPSRESLEHSGSVGKREHVGTDGPISDPNMVSRDQPIRPGVYGAHPVEDVTGGHHTVTEPHTGLPMNVERYGDGHGGTDGSQTIPGQHQVPGESATNWEDVRKKDTLY
ncbi:hypothetical protein BU23DRAFT_574889 [Bimuria novae-zelandiae CBS 107.79]|uniref:Uncharacterized protein n=1 Tax=Bimuria novae-zelandiae CBS 107.79 TaxID=1447943 RepID=A0A6A5UL25_9PLEO|nr:hypothetical protein BU23DRAFT_574889 [Bimuria novae-zelandiae CBS 107.79]